MAALVKDRFTDKRAGVDFHFPVAAGARIFAGAIVCLNAQGYAVPAKTAADLKFPARAECAVDNREGGDGAESVSVSLSVFGLDSAGDITRAHIGQPVYLVDDHTVSSVAAGKSRAGLLVDIERGQYWVDLTR